MVVKVSGHIANNLVADTNLKVPKGEVHQLIYKDQLLMVVEFASHYLLPEKVAPSIPFLLEGNELWTKVFLDSHTRITKEPPSRLL